MTNYELVLPEYFQDYAYEYEAKGWFSHVRLHYMGRQFPLSFYDPIRLMQEIEGELRRSPVFTEPNLLVVASITEAAMREAVEYAIATGFVEMFVTA